MAPEGKHRNTRNRTVTADPVTLRDEAQRIRKRWAKRRDECRRAYDEYVRCRQIQTEAGNELYAVEQQLADAMVEVFDE